MTLKYNEAMEKVEVTDEMRERILAAVSDRTSKKNKKLMAFPNWRRLAGLVACAAMVILCAVTIPRILNSNNSNEGDLSAVNEIVECEGIESLSQCAGFEINELKGLPFDVVECTYTWWFDSFAQIEYVGEDNEITYRVAESEEDISGDYNDYSEIQEEKIDQYTVTIKGNDGKAYLAIWTDGRYSYAIYSSGGISYNEMMRIISE